MKKKLSGLWWSLIGLVILLGTAAPSRAQDGGECPAKVLLAMARAGSTCHDLEYDQACYGNGAVLATFLSGGDSPFGAPGDRVDARTLHHITIGGDPEAWSVALLNVRADLAPSEQRSVTLLAFGEVEIENTVPPVPELIVSSIGILYVRTMPLDNGEIVKELGLRDTLIANGRTRDGLWLRVFVPQSAALGWVSTAVIKPEGDLNSLEIVDENTPYFRAFQVFKLQTGTDDALCDKAPESGLLIQTPNVTTPATLTINGVRLQLAGTAYLQAGDRVVINLLDGQAEIESAEIVRYLPAGTRSEIMLGADRMANDAPAVSGPYLLDKLAALPINNLPYRFVLPTPPGQEIIDSLVAAHFAPTPTPFPADTGENASACVRRVIENTSLRAGPGNFYEVTNSILAGRRITPVLEVRDMNGDAWWQLYTNNWILASRVQTSGECEAVPVSDFAPPPTTNHLSLETCETSNGPLRQGQWVTIDFVPPAVATINEALEAPRIDPGRIIVGSQRMRVSASRPVKIADERYVLTYSTQWEAEPGTFRVSGKRLSYEVICDITVPLGR